LPPGGAASRTWSFIRRYLFLTILLQKLEMCRRWAPSEQAEI
jgi:hypothetical protein